VPPAADWDDRPRRRNLPAACPVIGWDDSEAANLLRFRDRLRANPAHFDASVARKRAAPAGGRTDNVPYNRAKQPFSRSLLAEEHP
jgi:GrpB-like predicted nucleotidyltransferase (UPF0157 family)